MVRRTVAAVRPRKPTNDAEAICEAVSRPTMRFVPIKTVDDQGVLMLHRARELLIRQRTMTINALRAHLAEIGIVARQGAAGAKFLVELLKVGNEETLPEMVRTALLPLARQVEDLNAKVAELDKELARWHGESEVSRRLATIPGVGPITASAIAATVTDASVFGSGRELAAWLGLAPRQNSSGGRERLGRITKKGDPYIRRLLVVGALAAIRVHRRALKRGHGSRAFASGSLKSSPRSRWPTRWPGSSGL
jgi:transposase